MELRHHYIEFYSSTHLYVSLIEKIVLGGHQTLQVFVIISLPILMLYSRLLLACFVPYCLSIACLFFG